MANAVLCGTCGLRHDVHCLFGGVAPGQTRVGNVRMASGIDPVRPSRWFFDIAVFGRLSYGPLRRTSNLSRRQLCRCHQCCAVRICRRRFSLRPLALRAYRPLLRRLLHARTGHHQSTNDWPAARASDGLLSCRRISRLRFRLVYCQCHDSPRGLSWDCLSDSGRCAMFPMCCIIGRAVAVFSRD